MQDEEIKLKDEISESSIILSRIISRLDNEKVTFEDNSFNEHTSHDSHSEHMNYDYN